MYTLQFDGLFRNVPDKGRPQAGIMCYGWLIFKGEVVIATGHGAFARDRQATSNIAEYLALIEGLDALRDLGVENEPVKICGDAKGVIDQMQGEAEVNAASVKPVYRRACKLAKCFVNIEWVWTPRRYNRSADLLTRRAMRQVRSDQLNYQAALQAIDPHSEQYTRNHQFLPLLDLRIYQTFTSIPRSG